MLSRVCRSLFSSRVYFSWEIRFEANPFRWHRLHSIAFALLLRERRQRIQVESNTLGRGLAYPELILAKGNVGTVPFASRFWQKHHGTTRKYRGNIWNTEKHHQNRTKYDICYGHVTNGTANAGSFFPNVCSMPTWEAGRVLQMPWMWQALWVKARHRVTTKWIFWTNSMCPCVNFGTLFFSLISGSFGEFVDANVENVPMIHWTRYFLVTRKVRSSCRRVGVSAKRVSPDGFVLGCAWPKFLEGHGLQLRRGEEGLGGLSIFRV